MRKGASDSVLTPEDDGRLLVFASQQNVEIACQLVVHEDLDVRPYRILLVDDAKPKPRVARVQLSKHLVERRAVSFHFVLLSGVRPQRGRNVDLHFKCSAISTA